MVPLNDKSNIDSFIFLNLPISCVCCFHFFDSFFDFVSSHLLARRVFLLIIVVLLLTAAGPFCAAGVSPPGTRPVWLSSCDSSIDSSTSSISYSYSSSPGA